jgi:hypothetical protein
MEEARELLLKHLYLQGGDGLGISDGRVYNACLDAIMEALTIPVVVNQRELLLKKQSDWLMLHTKLEVENIVSFTEEFKQ